MMGGIRGIAVRPFSGTTRRGPRHSYVLRELRKRGCRPSVDRYGNIWVEKGSGSRTILFSSHLDVDPHIRRILFKSRKSERGKMFRGVLDNAIGCYINLLLAEHGPKRGWRAMYVFTASEEVERNRPRRFAISAREVLKELKRRRIKPDLCIAIDVTHPKLLKPQHKLDWEEEYGENFDINDSTHCYLDGYSRPIAHRIGLALVKRFRSRKVGVREFSGHDEAHVYSKISPSFAFGPVVYGHFDRPDQHMPLSHLRTAIRFLRNV